MKGLVIALQGRKWWVASIEGSPPHEWAWLCRVDKPMDQCRLSLRADEFKGVEYGKPRRGCEASGVDCAP